MKFTYDPRYKVEYIRFQQTQAGIVSIRVSDELIVDIAADGTVYGIELLNANVQRHREGTGKLLLINEATNEQTELPLVTG